MVEEELLKRSGYHIACQLLFLLTVQGSKETSLYVLDCLFSVLIVGTLVVFVWRGTWTILDQCLYPSHPHWSAWTSMVSWDCLQHSDKEFSAPSKIHTTNFD
jgi:hypothetical protein